MWSFKINHYKVFHPGTLKEEDAKHVKDVENSRVTTTKKLLESKQKKRKLKGGGAQPRNKRRKLDKTHKSQ